jgi:hypothetical protein
MGCPNFCFFVQVFGGVSVFMIECSLGVPIMFEAIRAIQATTDAPYHKPHPVESKLNRPVFKMDLASPVFDLAVPEGDFKGYSPEAINALHAALMMQSYPVDAKKLEVQRRRSDQRTGLHAADISLLAFIDGLKPDGR